MVINFLAKKGYACYPEISRAITAAAQKSGIEQLFLTEPLLFSEKLLEGRTQQFTAAKNQSAEVAFIDRGIPDITAYLDYHGDDYPRKFTEANQKYRYDTVFIFEPWREIYNSDQERYESYEQALEIQGFLRESYKQLGYELIVMPRGSVEERAEFILKQSGLL